MSENRKFSEFIDGGTLRLSDSVVGLRSGDNYIFSSSSIQPINITGSGNPNGNVAGIGGINFYFDVLTSDLWRCKTGGSQITAVWEKIQSTAISDFRNATYTYYTDNGSVNSYSVNPSPAYEVIQIGSRITLLSNSTNTGPSTLSVNSFGSSNIIVGSTSGFNPLAGGEINNLGIYDFVYNGTNWILLNPSLISSSAISIIDIRNSKYTYYVGAGVVNAYSVNPNPDYVDLTVGSRISVLIGIENTGQSTLLLNGYSAYPILINSMSGYVSLSGGEIQSNSICDFVFNGTSWILLNPILNLSFDFINAIRESTYTYGVDSSGNLNNFVLNTNVPYQSVFNGTRVTMMAISTSAGDSRLNVSNLGYFHILVATNNGFRYLNSGEITVGGVYDFVFANNGWILLNPNEIDTPNLPPPPPSTYYAASVWSNALQTIDDTQIYTRINFDSINDDPYNLWDNVNKRFVVGKTGYFTFKANIYVHSFPLVPPGIHAYFMSLILRKNGNYVSSDIGNRLCEISVDQNVIFTEGIVLSGVFTDYADSPNDYYDLGIRIVGYLEGGAVGYVGGTTNFTNGCAFEISYAPLYIQPEVTGFYGSSIWLSVTQSFIGGSLLPEKINFDFINYDQYKLWNNINKRFVVGIPGYYTFSANINVNTSNFSSSSGTIRLILVKNGNYSLPVGIRLSEIVVKNDMTSIVLSGIVTDHATHSNDYYELAVQCDDVDISIGGSNPNQTLGCAFSITYCKGPFIPDL